MEIAYNLKELYLKFNKSGEYYKASGSLEENYDILKNRFGDSGIPEYNEFYGLLVNWKQEILNSFTTINGRRINNSYIESKNRILKKLIINANSFNEPVTESFIVSTNTINSLFKDENGWSNTLQSLKPNSMD